MDDQSHRAPSSASDGTRERLIKAGLYLFATHGIEGVRTRTLAEKAGANQSAIPYHFGGKEGVYAAVIEGIADDLAQALQKGGIGTAPPQKIKPCGIDACAGELRKIMKGFALAILSPDAPLERTMLIVREQLNPTKSFDVLFDRFIGPLHQAICHLVAELKSSDPDDMHVVIQAHALVGQALSFVVAQEAFLRRSRLTKIGPAEAEKIADTISTMAVAASLPP